MYVYMYMKNQMSTAVNYIQVTELKIAKRLGTRASMLVSNDTFMH